MTVEIPDDIAALPTTRAKSPGETAKVYWNERWFESMKLADKARAEALLEYGASHIRFGDKNDWGIDIVCPKCGKFNQWTLEQCKKCGHPFTEEMRAIVKKNMRKICSAYEGSLVSSLEPLVEHAKKTGDWSAVPRKAILKESSGIILTTSFEVAGRQVDHEIEILSAECVYGMNIFRDFFASVRDIVGGRSAATQNLLRDARRTVLGELRREALEVGADAVIAIDLDYQELSSGGKGGMLMLVANGTAVKLKES